LAGHQAVGQLLAAKPVVRCVWGVFGVCLWCVGVSRGQKVSTFV
jgi:hypothetical protein